MADYIEGQDLVKQDAYDAVLKLDKMMGDLVAKFDLVAKSAISMNDTIVKSTSIPEVQQNQNTQKKNLDEIIKLEEKLKQAISDKGKVIELLRMEIAKQNAANKELVKDLQAQETSYNKLDLTLKKLKASYKAMTEAETQSTRGKELLSHIQQLDTKIKALDATMGVHNRNVGNYKNATFQLTQVMRELPNFAQSAEIGIRSLSNNLPMLADSFGQVRKEAGGTLPALKIFASSLFTFAGIFPLVLTGLIAYSDEIIKFITGTKEANEFTKEMGENIGKQTGEIERMSRALNSENVSHNTKLEIANKLLKIYPTTLSNYSAEEIAAGNAAGAIDTLKDSLVNLAIAKAAQADLDKQADKRWQQEVKRQGLLIDLAKAQAEETRATAAAEKAMQNPPRSESQSMLYDVIIQKRVDAENAVISIQEEIQKLDYDTSQTNKTMNKLAVNISKITSGVKKKTGLDEDGSDPLSKKKAKKPKKETEVNRITALEAQYKYEQNLLDIAFKKKEITEEEYYFKSMMLAERSQVHKAGLNAKELQSQKELNIKLEELAVDYSNKLQSIAAKEMKIVEFDAEKQAKIKEEELKKKSKWLDEYIKADLERIKNFNQKEKDETKKKTDEIKEVEAAYQQFKIDGINAFADISRTITDRIMSDIEARSTKEIEAIDLKEQAELDAIDRLTLSDSEREERKKIVELQAEARRKKIEQDKIRDLRKYALFQKGIDAGQIIANTALAVTGVIRNPSIPEPAKPFYIASYIALGTAQLAKVLATPLPQYEFGTPEGGHTGGKAIVGEAGTELGRTPDGKLFLTPSKASIMDLPKRTEIIPHDITKDLLGATMVRLAQANTAVSLDMYQDELIEAFERGTDKITKAIYKNRTNISIGGNYRDYVKSNQL